MEPQWPDAIEWRHVQNEGAPELYMADFGPFTLYAEWEERGWRASLEACADGSAAWFVADDLLYETADAACWASSRLLRNTLETAWHAVLRAIFAHQLVVIGKGGSS